MDVIVDSSAKVAIDGVCVANCGAQIGDTAFWILITIMVVCFGAAGILLIWGYLHNWGEPIKEFKIPDSHATTTNPQLVRQMMGSKWPDTQLLHQIDAAIERTKLRASIIPPPKVPIEFLRMLSDTPLQK